MITNTDSVGEITYISAIDLGKYKYYQKHSSLNLTMKPDPLVILTIKSCRSALYNMPSSQNYKSNIKNKLRRADDSIFKPCTRNVINNHRTLLPQKRALGRDQSTAPMLIDKTTITRFNGDWNYWGRMPAYSTPFSQEALEMMVL